MRIGATKRPFYRVVAVDERKKRTGQYLELLGTYNPLTQPKEIILKKDRIEHWTKQGAVLSHGFLRIMGEAPQKPPRKPRKEQPEKPAAAPAEEASEAPAAEETTASVEEAPQTEVAQTEETPAPVEETAVTESTETPTESPADVEPTATEEAQTEETKE